MHWKRRRPKWPYLVALGCLFILTLVAPWSWQRSRAGRHRSAAAPIAPPSKLQLAHPTPETKPAPYQPTPMVPALAAPSAPEPALSGPMVLADDYVAVDEPLVEPRKPPVEGANEATPPAVKTFIFRRPSGHSVVVHNAVASAAAPSVFNVESLVKVRDALLAMVETARQAQVAAEPATPPTLTSSMRVVVESENDRLAMITPRFAAAPPPELAPVNSPRLQSPPWQTHAQPALRHRPTALIEQLEALTAGSPAAPWAYHVLMRVEQLSEAPTPFDHDWQPTIAELRHLADHGMTEALAVDEPAEQSAWIRASRALDRRLPVWSLLVDRHYRKEMLGPTAPIDETGLIQALHEVAALTAGTPEAATWRDYLRLDDLAGLTSIAGRDYAEARRATARDVLVRMNDPWLTTAQRQFLAEAPVTGLAVELRPWASGEISLDALAALIERYELRGDLRDADAIAELRLRMKWSANPRLQTLSDDLNRHYRNANLRIAFAGKLMNRMIPPQEAVEAPVRSRIVGADVRGRSETETQIRVRLLPDPVVWRFGLEATGHVHSRTVSQTWPAKLRNQSTMEYEVRKLILINRYGLHAFPAESRADGNTNLVGIESEFSPVPIIGALVENAAREQHRQNKSQAIAEVKARVGREARERMDQEADAKLASFESRFREHVLEPMTRFALTAEPIDMSTTADRAQMRLRLASEQHLGAHTPRPSAPSDSLASVQLHESALNNALRGLGLDGRRMTVGELHHVLSEKIRRHAAAEPADLPRAAKVEFAQHDAVRVICHDDRIELVLNIVELRHGRDKIRGVGVHAFFRPVADGMELKLVREGSLQFDGAHLRTGPRMVLHSVFGKLLPKDQEAPVLAAGLSDDPRFAGLMVTQLVIDDGWLAMSIGPALPNRTAWRTHGVEVK